MFLPFVLFFDKAFASKASGNVFSRFDRQMIRVDSQMAFEIVVKFLASHMRHSSGPAAGDSVCSFFDCLSFRTSNARARFRRERTVPTAHSKRQAASA